MWTSQWFYPILGCLLNAFLYVGLLYLWGNASRTDPKVVLKRSASVVLTCFVTWIPVNLTLQVIREKNSWDGTLLEVLGLRLNGLLFACSISLILTALFFLGPLLYLTTEYLQIKIGRWVPTVFTLRNLVIAPISEEFVFRACMVPLFALQGSSTSTIVFITPLFFGAAHLHHLHDLTRYQGYTLAAASQTVAFQLAYTTVFGWYATYLFLRTGHLAAPVLAHFLCNAVGMPPFGKMFSGPDRLWYQVATVTGVISFFMALQVATDPGLYACNLPWCARQW